MRLRATIPTGIRIGYTERPASGGTEFPVVDPATEEVVAHVANATSPDWNEALDLAHAAAPTLAAMPARARSQALREIFEAVKERTEDFATTMTVEMGKPLAEARGEVSYGNEYFRWFSEEAARINGRVTPAPAGGGTIATTKHPVGPVLAITPWNFPLAMGTRKIGPAVAAGCTMVFKPANLTPLTSLYVVDVLREATHDPATYRYPRFSDTLPLRAAAADLPRRQAPPPVFTPIPVFTWTGFYAGLESAYTFTDNQRMALATRYDECAAEGCDRPFAWTEIHHLRPWEAGGLTDLDNAAPLCGTHHHMIDSALWRHVVTRLGNGTVSLAFHRRT